MSKTRTSPLPSHLQQQPHEGHLLRPVELPLRSPEPAAQQFGSDVVAQALRDLDLPFIALTPGASFRGLEDSLVNYLGNETPKMLVCIHEEHAVAIAQGYAKVTGRPIAVALHSNVGLMHATMAIFNAWCDRMPMLILGATGPVDAANRRPWIDWIHTSADQGALVRPYVKWDDEPASPAAARESIVRAMWLSRTAPMGPVYVNLDAGMQEAPLEKPLPLLDVSRLNPSIDQSPPDVLIGEVVAALMAAERPVILTGRVSRDLKAWEARIALAELTGARVATDLKVGAGFPTDHPLHVGAPGIFASPELQEILRNADMIISLDWVDLAGTLKTACGDEQPTANVVQISLDQGLHNGWSKDHQGLPPVDLFLAADPDAAVLRMVEQLDRNSEGRSGDFAAAPAVSHERAPATDGLTVDDMTLALRHIVNGRDISFLHLPLAWNSALWPFHHPLDYLGSDGGGGIGGGPGIAVGAALALRDTGRLPIAIVGDGDFLMGATALWTATHYGIPMLMIIANNQSFYNDEVHQERMARARNRPVENKWIGQRLSDPDINLAKIAEAQGAVGFGPVTAAEEMEQALRNAIRAVDGGAVAVVDLRVRPGYTPAMVSGLNKHVGK